MQLSELCIKRPVFTTVMTLVLVIIGLLSFRFLDLRYDPKVQQPIVWVYTEWSGASAEVVENNITRPIEDNLAGISGIESIISNSSNGQSEITVSFIPSDKTDFADQINQVRSAVGNTRLPEGVEPSKVSTAGRSGKFLMIMSVQSPGKSPQVLQNYLERNVKDRIDEIPGVAQANVYGAADYAVRIWLDSGKMATRKVSASQVAQVLEQNNFELPSGSIRGHDRNITINTNTRIKSLKEFERLIIRSNEHEIVRLADIAKVEMGSEAMDAFYMRVNGKSAVGIQVIAANDANPIEVSKAVRERLDSIRVGLPAGMTISVGIDMSNFLKESIHEVYKTIFEAVFLVMLFTYLFLGSIRAAIIPIITIPVCLIAAFASMAAFNFSVNIFTLLALVLAIGLVVDDAIVVLENVHRNILSGLKPFPAALKGSKEIGMAVIGMTITLVAVYAPIGFMKDTSAIIFREFAYTLAGAVLISGFVALTLSPMLCARVLTAHAGENKFELFLEKLFFNVGLKYKTMLTVLLRWRIWVVFALFGLASGMYFLFHSMNSEFIPKEDMGVIGVSINAPKNSSLSYTVPYVDHIEKGLLSSPYTAATYTYGGWVPSSAFNFVRLTNWRERDKQTPVIVDELNKKLNQIAGVNGYAFNYPPPIGGNAGDFGNASVAFQLISSGEYEQLAEHAKVLSKALDKHPDIKMGDTSLSFDSQQYEVSINRDLANQLGVSVKDIGDTLSVMLGGRRVTEYEAGRNNYPVILQLQEKQLADLSVLQTLYVPGKDKLVPLDNLLKVKDAVNLDSRAHFDRLRSTYLSGELSPGYSLSEAVKYIEQTARQVLPSDTRIEFVGAAKQMMESSDSSILLFALALLFIYLVLAALYESFLDPFIILLTVPLCVVGALFSLKMAGGTLNLYTNIGFITLIGLVSKHGILITEFANQQMKQGLDAFEAVKEAAAIRLRPIVMTTVTMICGALPLALATGPGSASRQQLGWVIIGGLVVGTLFSLIVVPIAYTLLARFKLRALDNISIT